jgi:hypothetical protein
MDWQALFNFVSGASLLAIGWAARTMYESIRELQRDLAAHKEKVAETYATSGEVSEIVKKLDEILRYLRK